MDIYRLKEKGATLQEQEKVIHMYKGTFRS